MLKTDWLLLSGVLDGYTDSYLVKTGKCGKPIESEKSSSSATKQNETQDNLVPKRTECHEGSLQEGVGGIRTSGVLFFQRYGKEVLKESQGVPANDKRVPSGRKTKRHLGKKKKRPRHS